MANKETYRDYLKKEFSDLIEKIDLSDLQRRFMKNRWLDQVLWLESRATKNRNRHYTLRLITIIGGVIVPALVSVNSANISDQKRDYKAVFAWTAFGLSQAVAISAAVEELFHFGENYRRYRNTAEGMKIEGWNFFQLSGPYKGFPTHAEAYPTFATHVEEIIQQDVEGYISQSTQSEAEVKAATNAAIAQNVALASTHLKEQLQQPPTPQVTRFPNDATPFSNNSVPPGFGPSAQQPWQEEDDDEFVSPNQFRPVSAASVNSPVGIGSPSSFSPPATFVTNSSSGVAHEEDEFLTPDKIQTPQFQSSFNNREFAPPASVPNPVTFTSTPTPPVASSEDDDEFITPNQLRAAQPGANFNSVRTS